MDCDPKEEFTISAIEKIDTPKFPGPLQQVNFLKELQSTELCQDYTGVVLESCLGMHMHSSSSR